MKRILIITAFFVLFCNSYAEEIFVGYLKPYVKKEQDKTIFKRKDPTEEPIIFFNRIMGSAGSKAIELEGVELKAILYNPKHKRAFINDMLLAEGEGFDGYTIKEIKESEVTITRNNKNFVLKIEEGDKK